MTADQSTMIVCLVLVLVFVLILAKISDLIGKVAMALMSLIMFAVLVAMIFVKVDTGHAGKLSTLSEHQSLCVQYASSDGRLLVLINQNKEPHLIELGQEEYEHTQQLEKVLTPCSSEQRYRIGELDGVKILRRIETKEKASAQ